MKVIEKSKLDAVSKAHLFREVTCMKLVRHPNIVRLYDVIDTPSRLFLILEFGDGGDMYDYIMKHPNGLSESLARKYFQQICQGLEYCHEMRVCHRDLKVILLAEEHLYSPILIGHFQPENLVFFEKQGVVKLTDFGKLRSIRDDREHLFSLRQVFPINSHRIPNYLPVVDRWFTQRRRFFWVIHTMHPPLVSDVDGQCFERDV